jgi:TRAP transporter TAXI family solute receptor
MKRLSAILISFCIVLIIVSCAAPAPTPSPAAKPSPAPATAPKLPDKIEFSTHRTGTTHYAVATGLAKVASEKGPILVSVAATSGPPAWVPQMNSTGNPQLGTAHPMDVWWAYTGKIAPKPIPDDMLGTTPPYAQAYSNLRVLAATARMGSGFLVRTDSPYKTAKDLKGARLASGFAAQMSAFIALIVDVLNANLTLKDFKEVAVSDIVAGVNALAEGRVDVTNCGVGTPAATEADAKVGVRWLSASGDTADMKRAMDAFAGGAYEMWEGGTPGLKEATRLWTYPIMIVTPPSLPDEVAESLLTTWWDNYKLLWEVHPSLKKITSPEMFFLRKTTVPYHTGAIKFYKKKGLWDAKMDAYQDRLLKGEYPFLD